MRGIGSKTAGTLSLFAIAAGVAIATGLFRPEHLARANGASAFLVGLIAAIAGTFAWNWWRLADRSARYFRWASGPLDDDEAHFVGSERRRIAIGDNRDGDAFDLPPQAQYAICLLIVFLLGIGTLDERAFQRLAHWPASISSFGAEYCPVADEAPAPKKPENDPNEPGCALIRRAYALGYAKTLGDCAPKKKEPGEDETKICTLRQFDEPSLHYAWRLLTGKVEKVSDAFAASSSAPPLAAQMDRLDILADAQAQVISGAPRASHHVFTNLPDPGGAFSPLTCVDRYRELPHRPPSEEPSKVFEHVLGQLLFETRYEPAAGYCREFEVHWSQPLDTCAKLAKDPDGVLASTGALASVRATLDRYRLQGELKPDADRRDPEAYVSFQCYMQVVSPASAGHTSRSFSVGGYPFQVEERRVAGSNGHDAERLDVDRYGQIAQMLDPHFEYGALLSDAGVEAAVTRPNLDAMFAERDFRLSRLWGLASVDLFLDPEALARRPDVLEVYPYHLHLKNYVELFRKQYRRERGRM